jgi:hypothetical protein
MSDKVDTSREAVEAAVENARPTWDRSGMSWWQASPHAYEELTELVRALLDDRDELSLMLVRTEEYFRSLLNERDALKQAFADHAVQCPQCHEAIARELCGS